MREGDRGVKIIKCHCDHEHQDERYGKKMRVHNKKAESKGWRCTVCTDEKIGR